MNSTDKQAQPNGQENSHFATTSWSLVLAAGGRSQEALAELCQAYWYPIYAYVRRRVPDVNEAQDLTQEFFCRLLEKEAIARAQPHRGRFRAFLLTALKNFLANEWNKARAQKRGGGKTRLSFDFDSAESLIQIEPFHELTPEKLFERRWVVALVNEVLNRLQAEFAEAGKLHHFEQLKGALTGELAADEYERAGETLGITPAAAKQAAYRMRKRYREMFRREVARTTAAEEDIEDEMRRLLRNLA
jgi:RNA polymerase sigma-70 factor (ECF subfamily)